MNFWIFLIYYILGSQFILVGTKSGDIYEFNLPEIKKSDYLVQDY